MRKSQVEEGKISNSGRRARIVTVKENFLTCLMLSLKSFQRFNKGAQENYA